MSEGPRNKADRLCQAGINNGSNLKIRIQNFIRNRIRTHDYSAPDNRHRRCIKHDLSR